MYGEENQPSHAREAAADADGVREQGGYKVTTNTVSWTIPSDSGAPPPSCSDVELSNMNRSDIEEPRVLCIVQDETKTSLNKYTITLPASTAVCDLYVEVAKLAAYENGTFLLSWLTTNEWSVETQDVLGENSTASLFEMHIPPRPRRNTFYLKEKDSGPPKPVTSSDDGNVAKKNAINKASNSGTSESVTSENNNAKSSSSTGTSVWSYSSQDPFGDADYRGLVNQAMTCYLNSLLQSLFMSPEFRNGLYNCEFPVGDREKSMKNIPYQLQRLFLKLQTSKKRAIETTDVTKSFGWDSGEAWQQHDVQELCRVMFDAIEHRLRGTDRADLIKRLYEGEIKDYVKCLECNTESSRHDTFLDVPLSVKPFGANKAMESVEEALRKFSEPEILKEDNQYSCAKCQRKCDAHKGLKFVRFPNLLTLQLKRFDLDYVTFQRVKLNDKMTFPRVLNLNPFVDPEDLPKETADKEDEVVLSADKEEKQVPTTATASEQTSLEQEEPAKLVATADKEEQNAHDKPHPLREEKDGVVMETAGESDPVPVVPKVSLEEQQPCNAVSSTAEVQSSEVSSSTGHDQSTSVHPLTPPTTPPPSQPNREESEEAPLLVSPVQENGSNGSSAQVGLPNIVVSSTHEDSTTQEDSTGQDNRSEPVVTDSNSAEAHAQRISGDEADVAEALKSGPYVYELFSVMVHSGSALGGHYYAYIKSFKNHQWYCFNDHTVTTASLSEVERAFGGLSSSRGYYSSAYASSANAYMLMYRQVREDNQSFMEEDIFPQFLKNVKDDEERIEEEERRKEQRKKETSSLKLFYHHPETRALLYEKVDVHKDETFRQTTDAAYKMLDFKRHKIPREQCRIVRYDDYYDLIERSWEDMEDDPMSKVFGGAKRFYSFELYMETRSAGAEFPRYDETEIVVRYHVVELAEGDSHLAIRPTRDLRLQQQTTILELKQKLAEAAGLKAPLVRMLWEKYHNETVCLASDEATLRGSGMHRKAKVFVEGVDEEDHALPLEESRFRHTVEEYLHLIHVDVFMPEEEVVEKATADCSYKTEAEKLVEKPPLFSLKIDKRKTLGDLKDVLAARIGLQQLHFKIYRVYGNSQEFELYRLEDSLRSNPESTKVIIRKGRALQTDEFRVKMFLLDLSLPEHSKELFEAIIGKGQTVAQVKEVVLETAKEKAVDLEMGVERMRLRRKQWKSPGIIFLDDMVVAKDFQIFLSMEFFIERLPGPEPMQQSNHIQVYARRWRPSLMAIDGFQEVIVSTSQLPCMMQQIAELSDIPLERIEFAKGHGTFPHDISVLDIDKELNWNPDCDTISSHPLYITTDGFVIYYRDGEEKPKELSKEEMEELRTSENKRLNKYYSSGYSSSSTTRWTRKEKALKIYTDDDNDPPARSNETATNVTHETTEATTTETTTTTTTTTASSAQGDDLGLD